MKPTKYLIPSAIVALLAFLLLPLAETLFGTGQSHVEGLTDVVNVVIAVGVGLSFGWFIYRGDKVGKQHVEDAIKRRRKNP